MSSPNSSCVGVIKCRASVSLVPQNLSSSHKFVAYIHKNEVYLVEQKNITLGVEKSDSIKCTYAEKDPVTTVEYLHLSALTSNELLVITTLGGAVHIYEENGQKCLGSYKVDKKAPTVKDQYFRGIASDGRDTLYVGVGTGEVYQLTVPAGSSASSAFQLTLAGTLAVSSSSSDHGISAVACVGTKVITGDDKGNVNFWEGSKCVKTINGVGSPVTVLRVGHGYAVGAFASGHLRYYSLSNNCLAIEITAHTRSISAVDIHKDKPLVVCASEDTFISVWTLPSSKDAHVRHILTESPAAGLLAGVKFTAENQKFIVTTVYDSRALHLLHTP